MPQLLKLNVPSDFEFALMREQERVQRGATLQQQRQRRGERTEDYQRGLDLEWMRNRNLLMRGEYQAKVQRAQEAERQQLMSTYRIQYLREQEKLREAGRQRYATMWERGHLGDPQHALAQSIGVRVESASEAAMIAGIQSYHEGIAKGQRKTEIIASLIQLFTQDFEDHGIPEAEQDAVLNLVSAGSLTEAYRERTALIKAAGATQEEMHRKKLEEELSDLLSRKLALEKNIDQMRMLGGGQGTEQFESGSLDVIADLDKQIEAKRAALLGLSQPAKKDTATTEGRPGVRVLIEQARLENKLAQTILDANGIEWRE